MSDVVRCGYTDTEWVARVARPRVRASMLALAARRSTGKLNGRMTAATLSAMERAMSPRTAAIEWCMP